MEVKLVEEVKEGYYDLEDKLWSREKPWQAQLFTLTNGMNSTWDWFKVIERAIKRRKNDNILLLVFSMFDFVCKYSKVQHLCFGLYAYLSICLIYIVKIFFDSAIS